MMPNKVFPFFCGIGLAVNIPFDFDNAANLIYVNGTIEDIDGLLDPIGPVKLYLQFDTQSWLEFESPENDTSNHNDLDVYGIVKLQSENGTLVDAYEDSFIALLDFQQESIFSKGFIGVGQNGPFLNQRHSIGIVLSEKRLMIGISDFDFNATYCHPNTFLQVPFSSPIPQDRISRKLAGQFRLVELHTFVPVVLSVTETAQLMTEDFLIQIIPERLFIPEIFFREILSRVPVLTSGLMFENCEQVLHLLPIISLELFDEAGFVAGTIHFYPSDYIVREAGRDDTCSLILASSGTYAPHTSIIGFDPLLLRESNILISDTHLSFCDRID